MTRVAYIGNFKHPHCTEVVLAEAFRTLGCTVLCWQQEDIERAGPQPLFARVSREHPQLLLYTRTHNHTALGQGAWHADAWTETWRKIERAGVVTASVHLDRFWDLPERERWIADGDPLFTTAHVFTADGGNDDRWAAAGVAHRWLPPAIDARAVGLAAPHRRFAHDVVFVGSDSTYHGEYPARGELVRFLRSRYGNRFCRYGVGAQVVRGTPLATLYASAKVVVGDSCFANEPGGVRARRYVSDRVFETLGRGGVLVHAHLPGMIGDYGLLPGVHLMTHEPGDWDALATTIDWLLERPEHRDCMRRDAVARVANGHTYTHRAATLLHAVGLRACDTIDCDEAAA